jgi:diguanylate cyclase (GGDEF)-like protein
MMKRSFGYRYVSIYLLGENILRLGAQAGYDEKDIFYEIPISRGIAGRTVRTRQIQFISEVDNDPDFLRASGGVTCEICVPLLIEQRVLGILNIESGSERPLTDTDVDLLSIFASQVAVAVENAQLHAEMQRQAITDALTGLFNLRGLHEFGRREIERARRFHRPLAGILLDIDHFKRVNDTYSHAIGNQILCGLANRLHEQVRDIDIAARYGGEEFVILLPETDLRAAQKVAERLRKEVADRPFPTDCGPLAITISLGVVAFSGDIPDLNTLLDRADATMYAAKHAGRNQVCTA